MGKGVSCNCFASQTLPEQFLAARRDHTNNKQQVEGKHLVCACIFNLNAQSGKVNHQYHTMRPLTDEETKVLFEKLANYIGKSIEQLINRSGEPHCFRLHKDRVYYVSERLIRQSTNIARDDLLSFGTCFGKFTRSHKFRLHITCLDFLAQYAKHKVWVRPNAEMSFLYGNHVPKAGLARMSEGTPQYGGVVVYSMGDVPLGFGVAAQPTEYCKDLDPTATVVLHQADVGEYLRIEDDLL
ncbi:unnamed protein product [Phaeothamnion confervicola]